MPRECPPKPRGRVRPDARPTEGGGICRRTLVLAGSRWCWQSRPASPSPRKGCREVEARGPVERHCPAGESARRADPAESRGDRMPEALWRGHRVSSRVLGETSALGGSCSGLVWPETAARPRRQPGGAPATRIGNQCVGAATGHITEHAMTPLNTIARGTGRRVRSCSPRHDLEEVERRLEALIAVLERCQDRTWLVGTC